VFHTEPYILNDTRRERQLDTFLAREAGRPLRGSADALPPDFVAGATVSARAMRAAVVASARLVLRGRGAGRIVSIPTLDADSFSVMSWDELLATGAVARRQITSGEVAAAFEKAGASGTTLDVPLGKPDDLYADVMTGLFTPRAIGGNLLGLQNFEEYLRVMPVGAQVVVIASNGPYEFLDAKYRLVDGRRFDRLRVIQDGQIIDFARDGFRRLQTSRGSEGIRSQQAAALLALAPESGFDPIKPWRLELLVNGAGAAPATIAFGVDYKIPDAHILMPDPPPIPIWVEAWKDSRLNIAILAVLLAVLTLIFVFQAALARFRLAHRLVRNGFLVIVLVWLGWIAGVQLSIVNVINYVQAPFRGVDIGFYLAEPLMVMVALYTLLSVVLIGRGVFCGWLCPFGALQELLGQLSRAIGVPQWQPPAALEKRLWLGKYIAATVVLALVISALDPPPPRPKLSRSRLPSLRNLPAPCPMCSTPARCWLSGCSASAPTADSCVRWVACWPSSIACISSIFSSAAPNAAILVICANDPVLCARSRRPAGSSPPNAFSASIAKSNIMTRHAARRWCGPPSCATRQSPSR
jgi:hypothetical protein